MSLTSVSTSDSQSSTSVDCNKVVTKIIIDIDANQLEDALDDGIKVSSNHKTSPITCDNIRESPSISNKLAITANEHSYANEDVVKAKQLHTSETITTPSVSKQRPAQHKKSNDEIEEQTMKDAFNRMIEKKN